MEGMGETSALLQSELLQDLLDDNDVGEDLVGGIPALLQGCHEVQGDPLRRLNRGTPKGEGDGAASRQRPHLIACRRCSGCICRAPELDFGHVEALAEEGWGSRYLGQKEGIHHR